MVLRVASVPARIARPRDRFDEWQKILALRSARTTREKCVAVARRRRQKLLRNFARQVEALARRAVAIGEEPPDRVVVFLGDALGLRIDDAVARVHELDLAEHQLTRRADHDQALDLAL